MIRSHPRRRLVTIVMAGATALATTSALAIAATPAPAARPGESARAEHSARTGGHVDARKGLGESGRNAVQRAAGRALNRPSTKQLTRSLGASAIVDIDGNTGTPRRVAARSGFLTGRSSAPASSIALGYVRGHAAALGLAGADLATFRLRRDYVDIDGIHHLSFTQVVRGYTVFGNGLQAAVTRDGRLLMLGGSPVPSAMVKAPAAARLTAGQALTRASGETIAPSPRDLASKVLFVTRGTTYLGWRTVSMSADEPAVSVVDAATGRVVFRQPLVNHERAELAKPKPQSRGVAFRYHPKAKHGGKYETFNFTKRGWLRGRAKTLDGNNAHAYSDVNDNNKPSKSEEVGPKKGTHSWSYKIVPFHLKSISWCDNPYPCTWNPNKPFSWKTNREQNTTQVFYFVNQFHDYLKGQPVGFTEAAGNFQARNRSGNGLGRDAVQTQTLDGANTSSVPGLPDGGHIDNANMNTPPDGIAPTMQMYLQHQPGTTYPDEDPFPANNTGDEGDTVYHEYTHGLSNRLVVDAGGVSTLGPVQGGAMGEAWSDWYAFDYLVAKGLHIDKPATGDVRLGVYDGAGAALVRTEALDCPVSSTGANCTNQDTGHVGGYTYADYAQVIGGPEVHADGEIWAQTLWDLRGELGHFKTAKLVTRGMELAPENPSYLDMRDSILMADTAIYGGADETVLWQVFADRGMGYFAGSLTGDDTAPAADFSTPPAVLEFADITGTVTDSETGLPIQGATVTLPFQGGGATVNPSATTAADGTYTISGAVVGSYAKLVVGGDGYEPEAQPVDVVVTTGAVADFQIRRDWAASSGGGSVLDFTGPDFTPDCGPDYAIDLSLATGWGSTTGDDFGTPTNHFINKYIIIELPQAVDVTAIAVDPTATCGDGGSASLGKYTIETSTNGLTFTQVAAGTFTDVDRGQLNELPVSTGGTAVTHVKLWMKGNQTPNFPLNCPDGAFSGCSYTDLSEIAVYGSPSP